MTKAALIAVPASLLVLCSSHARDQLCVVLEGHYEENCDARGLFSARRHCFARVKHFRNLLWFLIA
jgi:hypothetical protein